MAVVKSKRRQNYRTIFSNSLVLCVTCFLRTILCTEDEKMHSFLEDELTIIYLEFMSYCLGILTDFNVMFQAESALFYKIMPEIKKLLKNICINYMQLDFIRNYDILTSNHSNTDCFLKIDDIYVGTQSNDLLNKVKEKENIRKFKQNCLNFYVELVTQIKNRFDFSDPVFELASVVDPETAQNFKIKSLLPILRRLPVLEVDAQILDNEWKEHALLNHSDLDLNANIEAEKYWKKVFNMKNVLGNELFPNLRKVINLLLCLPFSNASVERVFSHLKNIKSAERNCLKTETLSSILITKDAVNNKGGILKFEPTSKMVKSGNWNFEK